MTVTAGDRAPAFTGVDHNGQLFDLETRMGDSWLLIWFWPNAPIKGGCGHTLSKCGKTFRRNAHWLLERGCYVVGVNYDDPFTNWLWADAADENVPFRIISDEDRSIAELYGARRPDGADWGDVPRRLAFLVDPAGRVQRQWTITSGSGFVDEVFAALAELQPDLGVAAEAPIVYRDRWHWLRKRLPA